MSPISISTVRSFARTHWFVVAMTALGALLVALAFFEAGVMTGYHEARFSYGLDRNYERTFGGSENPMGGGMMAPTHGSRGTIVSIALPTLTISSPHNPEMVIHIASSTILRNQSETITAADLRVGDSIVVLGEPDDEQGVVLAHLIRVVPALPTATTTLQK